jgi:hypothetical protein
MDLYKIVNIIFFSDNDFETDETKDRLALSSERPPHGGKHCKGGKESGHEPQSGPNTKTDQLTVYHNTAWT